MPNIYADLLNSTVPPTTEVGRSLFDFGQKNYTDKNGISWNFFSPDAVPGYDYSGVNPVATGPQQLYNFGDQFYKDLGYTGQAWNMPTTQDQVSGLDSTGSINPEFVKWLQDKGYTFGEGRQGGDPYRGYFDKYGNPVALQRGAADTGAMENFALSALGLYGLGTAGAAALGSGAAPASTAGLSGLSAEEAAALAGSYGATDAAGLAAGTGLTSAAATAPAAVAPAAGAGTTLGIPNNLLGTGIAAGSQLLGGVLQNNANKDAIEAQQNAAAQSNALLKYMYDTQRSDQAPWMEAGKNALGNLTALLNSGELTSKFAGKFDPSQVQMDPGYQFGMDQGQKAIANSAAARGMGLSGATLKAANKFGTDYATTKYDQAYNRAYGRFNDDFNRFYAEKDNMLNPLFKLSGLGQNATNQVQQAGTNYANNTANNINSLGNAQAGSNLYRGNIYGNMLADLGGLAYQYFNKP